MVLLSAKKKALIVGLLPLIMCATLITNTVIWGFEGFTLTFILFIAVGFSVAIAINVYIEALKYFEKKEVRNENTITTNNSTTNYSSSRRF